MRLAFLLYKYFPYGGMQRDFRRFVEEIQKLGHICRVYYIEWQGEEIPGVELRRVAVSARTNHLRNERFTEWVQRDLSNDPVDGVVGFNKMPGLDVYYAADSCYLDKAINERGSLYRLGGRFRHFAAYEAAVFGRDSSTDVLLISATEKAKFLHCYKTPESRLHMLPPGISRDRCAGDDAPVRRLAMRQSLAVAEGEHVQLFVGSGFIKKGLDRAIRALAHATQEQPHQPMRLLVVGQDKERRFRRLARKLGVAAQVQFLGGRDDVADLLLGADVLVHPALDEAAGIVLLEALVAGLPVITTDVCGYAHHIAAAKAGMVMRSPFRQADLDAAVMRSLDGVYRSQCRETGLVYARVTDLYSMHSTGAKLIEQLVQRKRGIAGE
ncbi:glycosyltransferase family 4 protein [Pseudohalioglobus lutimaris]|uniref:Glucosyltransferase I RfaG n=1 Tax=Pseudohalioglobus lutimaris TaxID=1737061 RepID=A0A2N5X8K7_9GAMM|nr:glycosyltransferase family 4 protein [Pseudohalioglobus lutimaris]PLW70831.1 glucosyltransferase I RfaG [Pseudohalioglobus lutimaris]